MLLTLPLLDDAQVRDLRDLLDRADWQDGRASAGNQGVHVKRNHQLPRGSEAERAGQAIVMRALNQSPEFLSACLPRKLVPPYFNRYAGDANQFGPHIDGAIRYTETGQAVRTDLSCTVFLSDPDSYEGGELVLRDGLHEPTVKLAAGHAVVYGASHVHEVRPVTRGMRLASFLWIESLVRCEDQRRLLWEFDRTLTGLRSQGESAATVSLAGTYHNLLRMWAQT